MLIPLVVAGGVAAALYEFWWKPNHPAQPTAGGAPPQTLLSLAESAIAKVIPGISPAASPTNQVAAAAGQLSVVQTAPVTGTALTDPTAMAASLAANALLHGTATDPGVQTLVKAFQVAAGLTADGKYGPSTQAALQRYVPNAPAAPAVYGGTG